EKLRHSLGRPSRSDFVQLYFYELFVFLVSFANWDLSINSLNFPLFSRLPAIENSIYVSFSLVFALMG
ncbi:hypothetical protein, partial [Agathobacter rectalis]|uniref:hypothetical protein n=1 Tax=Agathobacter rectalis TaxID=39491 RepID=UPI0027D259CF